MPEEESNLTEGEEESSLMDELLPRVRNRDFIWPLMMSRMCSCSFFIGKKREFQSTLVFASTPSPNVLDQLRSWLWRHARQSRALRGNRALMPYVRYGRLRYMGVLLI